MINWWLIVVCAFVMLLVLAAVFYIVIVYSSPEDKNQAWAPKVVVVLSLSLACFTVLLLPFDVANRADPLILASLGGGLDLETMWQVCLISIAIDVVVILPFFIFYYEGWDPEHHNSIGHQIFPALGFTFLTMLVAFGLLITLWLTVGTTDIPYTIYTTPTVPYEPNGNMYPPNCNGCTYDNNAKLEISVSIFVYAVALLALVGWLLFIMFGSIGLAALPVDLMRDWFFRPKPIKTAEYAEKKNEIGKRAHELREQGKVIEEEQRKQGNKISNKVKRAVNRFQKDVRQVEDAYQNLETAFKKGGVSPFISWGKLLLGVFGIFLSILWVLHVLLHNILDLTPFLNDVFIKLDEGFALFGTIGYGVCTMYLLWCTVKGVLKVGLRLLIFEVHPMKPHDTLMNSFLFNCILILIASITVTQFSAASFRAYAANTAVDSMFQTYIMNLKGITYLFEYLPYIFAFTAIISFILMVLCYSGRKWKQRREGTRSSVFGSS
eukprot:TRINITY_DN66271_c6_g6_i1.p1 TRINITY_DN66271_c6_g6~~TRINITY_DN66271_c6_g6_i1.p1  ORF type:complete len:493 (-),score=25.84 TRINITY_DN66271_c6_g6_i1:528-2006(-)